MFRVDNGRSATQTRTMASSTAKHETEEDAITEEEITGTATPAATNAASAADILKGHDNAQLMVDQGTRDQPKSACMLLPNNPSEPDSQAH